MINSPFYCDYGFNTRFKGFAFLNYGTVILDTFPVTISQGTMIAQHVCIACSGHSVNYRQRIEGIMTSKTVTIDNHSVIDAGSTVTKSIPSDVIAFGSPCYVYRKITKRDLLKHVLGAN